MNQQGERGATGDRGITGPDGRDGPRGKEGPMGQLQVPARLIWIPIGVSVAVSLVMDQLLR